MTPSGPGSPSAVAHNGSTGSVASLAGLASHLRDRLAVRRDRCRADPPNDHTSRDTGVDPVRPTVRSDLRSKTAASGALRGVPRDEDSRRP